MSSDGLHRYQTSLRWSGSTAAGYDHYDRSHSVTAVPARAQLQLSSDAAFRGDPDLLNPEQLLVLAASSCQLLAFLAVAARARLDVIAYTDDAEALMPEDDPPIRITRIELHPRITLGLPTGGTPRMRDEQVLRLVRIAHDECFIASSLRAEMVITPILEWRVADRGADSGAAEGGG